jgi:PAS domain-containing protein
MGERPDDVTAGSTKGSRVEAIRRPSIAWAVAAVLGLILIVSALAARLAGGPELDGLLMTAAGAAAVLLCLRLVVRTAPPQAPPVPAPWHDVLDSAGPAVLAMEADGSMIYMNPSAERMLGYDAAELTQDFATTPLLGPGEGVRLVTELEKLGGREPVPGFESTPVSWRAA